MGPDLRSRHEPQQTAIILTVAKEPHTIMPEHQDNTTTDRVAPQPAPEPEVHPDNTEDEQKVPELHASEGIEDYHLATPHLTRSGKVFRTVTSRDDGVLHANYLNGTS
jgi:hypothetical protein